MNVHEIIDLVREIKGSNAKVAVLSQHSNNRALMNFISTVYDPMISFYILSYKTMEPAQKDSDDSEVESILDFMYSLSQRLLTGNAAQEAILEFSGKISAGGQELLKYIVNRDIQAGVGAATINKVWPKLIHIEPYMRCTLEKDAASPMHEWKEGYISQLKADGMFSYMNISNFASCITSRSGFAFPQSKPFLDLIEFVKQFEQTPVFNIYKLSDCAIEGELVIDINGKRLPREESNGMLNSLQQSGKELPEDAVIKFLVWDILPSKSRVHKGVFAIPYEQRFKTLEAIFTNPDELVTPIETAFFQTLEDTRAHFHEMLDRGEEGTVVKHPKAQWVAGDNKLQIKMKIEAECDLEITGFKAGDAKSKHAGTFGSIMLKTIDGDLVVNCSGLSDVMRNELWTNKDYYIGKVAAVRFNSIMKPKKEDDKHSLFLPRFIDVREDKDTADSLERVFEQFEDAKKKKVA